MSEQYLSADTISRHEHMWKNGAIAPSIFSQTL